MDKNNSHRFTIKIMMGMFSGALFGVLLKYLPLPLEVHNFIIDNILKVGGDIFYRLLCLLVIPVVFVSLVCGSFSLGDLRKIGRVGGKTILLYLITTAIAVAVAILIASLFKLGQGLAVAAPANYAAEKAPTFIDIITNLIPENPFKALAEGHMLQVIVFALLLGVAIAATGEKASKIASLFTALNEVILKLILMMMTLAPYGVFFLLATLFSRIGLSAFAHIIGYFFMVLLVLALQLFGFYSMMLTVFARLNPVRFFKKMYSTMLFAFSVSSSNASIPVVLRTVEFDLGVKNSVAAFTVPLGATVNMDGTAIMQGVATVFIANAYHLHIGFIGYLTVVAMATLASIGTAGVPGVGLVTLAMVLNQVGLPVEGITLIIGIDRLLDMARTVVNITGDSMIACIVAKSEGQFDREVFDRDS